MRCLHDAACLRRAQRQPRCAGIGTWQYNNSVAEAAVALALSLGYTHIDTAIGYDNQEGIARALKASSRPRSSYFLTSKIPGGLSQSDAAPPRGARPGVAARPGGGGEAGAHDL